LFRNRSLRIIYNLTKKNQKNHIYAILQTEGAGNFEEEANYFLNYFSNDSEEFSKNNQNLKENFKNMLKDKGLKKLLGYIKILESNFTPKNVLFQKFMELAQSNDDGYYFLFEEIRKNNENIRKNSGNLTPNTIKNNNVPILENSKIACEDARSFSFYSNNNDRTNSEEEMKKCSGEKEEIYSESRHLIMNLIHNKNISSY